MELQTEEMGLAIMKPLDGSSIYYVVATDSNGVRWAYNVRQMDGLEDAQRVLARMFRNRAAGQFETRFVWSPLDPSVELYSDPWDQMELKSTVVW
jgi:hypothetical protein